MNGRREEKEDRRERERREKRVEGRMRNKSFRTLASPVNRSGEGLGGAHLF